MSKRYAVCPQCGAMGVVGEQCDYCGTPIVIKENTATYEARIVSKRTIDPVAFAQKVSIFKNVGEYICNCAVVSMGELNGVINRNGDFIFPLEYGRIKLYDEGYAYLQKGSFHSLFDLTSWKRLFFIDAKNAPYELTRKIYKDYYCLTLYFETYYEGEFIKTARSYLLDQNDSLFFSARVINKVNTGFIDGGVKWTRSYYDIRLNKTFYCPSLDLDGFAHAGFTSKDGKLAMAYFTYFSGTEVSQFFALDIDGKTAEDIQKEIDRVIEEIKAAYHREKAIAKAIADREKAIADRKNAIGEVVNNVYGCFFLGIGVLVLLAFLYFTVTIFTM